MPFRRKISTYYWRRRRRFQPSSAKPVLSQASPRPDAQVGWPARRGETCKLPLYRACRWLCLLDFDVSLRSFPFVRPVRFVVQHFSRLSRCSFYWLPFPDDQHPRNMPRKVGFNVVYAMSKSDQIYNCEIKRELTSSDD